MHCLKSFMELCSGEKWINSIRICLRVWCYVRRQHSIYSECNKVKMPFQSLTTAKLCQNKLTFNQCLFSKTSENSVMTEKWMKSGIINKFDLSLHKLLFASIFFLFKFYYNFLNKQFIYANSFTRTIKCAATATTTKNEPWTHEYVKMCNKKPCFAFWNMIFLI